MLEKDKFLSRPQKVINITALRYFYISENFAVLLLFTLKNQLLSFFKKTNTFHGFFKKFSKETNIRLFRYSLYSFKKLLFLAIFHPHFLHQTNISLYRDQPSVPRKLILNFHYSKIRSITNISHRSAPIYCHQQQTLANSSKNSFKKSIRFLSSISKN